MSVFAVYKSELEELEIHFSAETERNDYGVPGSPVWQEVNPDTVNIDKFYLFGHLVKFDSLPENVQNDAYSLWDSLDWQ